MSAMKPYVMIGRLLIWGHLSHNSLGIAMYVINFEHNEDYLESVRRNSDRQMSEIIDEVLDRVIE